MLACCLRDNTCCLPDCYENYNSSALSAQGLLHVLTFDLDAITEPLEPSDEVVGSAVLVQLVEIGPAEILFEFDELPAHPTVSLPEPLMLFSMLDEASSRRKTSRGVNLAA
jgi:hypothetical protein